MMEERKGRALGEIPNNRRIFERAFPFQELYLSANAYQRPGSNRLREGAVMRLRVSLPGGGLEQGLLLRCPPENSTSTTNHVPKL